MTQPYLDLFERSARRLGARVCLGGDGKRPVYIWIRSKKREAEELDGEEAIGEEEGIPPKTTTGKE